ncbi:CPBP family intramembrane glutamic endopeptidase [Guggenheimella bovis]
MNKPFYSNRPLLVSILYLLLPLVFATSSGVAAVVMKLEGTDVVRAQIFAFLIAANIAFNLIHKRGGVQAVGYQNLKNVDPLVVVSIIIALALIVFNLSKGFRSNLSVDYVLTHALFALIVGFTEESIFRGLIYRTLRHNGLLKAVLISSFLFGVGHFLNLLQGADPMMTLNQVVFAFFFGITMCLFVIKTRSLYFPIAFHALHNYSEYLRVDFSSNVEVFHGIVYIIGFIVISIILFISLKPEDKKAVLINE